MTQMIDSQSERRTPSSSGRGASPQPERTLEAPGVTAAAPRGTDSTMALPVERATPPSSSDRLAMLAANLPAIERDAYKVGREVAKGGIGRVLLARDQRLDRPVAIKELLIWNRAAEQRFVREALLTARLQHPAIVPIYEAGRWPDGEPFYAMKLVSGRTLSDLIGEGKTLAERLALLPHVITAAQAIAYAHSQRIIHRDLKPANVLVGEFGETVVIDWGLAKGLSEEDDSVAPNDIAVSGDGLTMVGAVIGTPAYMPPEQAAGSRVDERADVYAIGAMLYHVIAAVPPYHDVAWDSLLAHIAKEPPRPVEKLAPAISDELCAIVQKAMARSPADRYRTARELAEDLHRFHTGQIVAAHTYSASQILRRFWRRNRAVLSITAAAVALLALVVIGAFIKTDSERRVALEHKEKAEKAEKNALAAQIASDEAGRLATARADEMTLLQAETALKVDPNSALAWLKTLSPGFADAAEMRRLAAEAQARGISRVFRGHTWHVNNLELFDGGKRFVTASDDGTLRVWDLESGQSQVFSQHTDEVWDVIVLAGGARLGSISKDRTLRIWDSTTLALLETIELPRAAAHIAMRPDGALVLTPEAGGGPWLVPAGTREVRTLSGPSEYVEWATSSEDGRLVVAQSKQSRFLLDTETGARRPLRNEPGPWTLSQDGRTAIHLGKDAPSYHEVELWDLEKATMKTVSMPGPGLKDRRTISKSGDFAVVCTEERIDVYDIRSGALKRQFAGQGAKMNVLKLSPDDRVLAIGGFDHVVRTLDLESGETQSYSGLGGMVSDIVFLPERRGILAASSAGDVRLFEPSRAGAILHDHKAKASGLAVSAEGRVALMDETGHLVIAGRGGEVIAEHSLAPTADALLVASPDRRRFAALTMRCAMRAGCPPWRKDEGKTLVLATFDSDKPLTVALPAPLNNLIWRPDGGSVLLALDDGSVQSVTLEGAMTPVDRLSSAATSLAISEDGNTLAAGAQDGLVRLIDLARGGHREFNHQNAPVLALALSRDGKWLASGAEDHTARIWRLEDGTFRSMIGGGGFFQVAFSQDSKTLVGAAFREVQVRRWAVESGEVLPSLTGHQGPVISFAFSGDGRRILTGSMDGSARLFDAVTTQSRAFAGHSGAVRAPSFAADGKGAVTLGDEGTVRTWPDELPETVKELRPWIEAATPDRISGH